MPLKLRILFMLFLLTAVPTADAQSLFAQDDILAIEIAGPLGELFANRYEESREERPFTLKTGDQEFDIRVRIRGKSRVRLCSFPPLRLNFSETDMADTPFTGQQKLKLVTHCKNSAYSETDVIEEYAAYRIFNVLTDRSYRVRLLHIRYTDTEGRIKGLQEPRYGFLIEPREQLAARAGGSLARVPGIALTRLDQQHAALMYVFQYLIGNTDWSLATASGEDFCCHNVTPIDIHSLLNPVPYDFDMSGLVNAGYALPNPELRKIDRVTQRLYRGYCTDPGVLRDAIARVVENRDAIRQTILDLPEIELKKKHQKTDFLERFFRDAEKGDRLFDRFEDHCLGNYTGNQK